MKCYRVLFQWKYCSELHTVFASCVPSLEMKLRTVVSDCRPHLYGKVARVRAIEVTAGNYHEVNAAIKAGDMSVFDVHAFQLSNAMYLPGTGIH